MFEKLSLKKFNKRERILFFSILCIFIVFFLDRFIFQQAAITLGQLNTEIDQQELAYKNSLVLVKNKDVIASRLKDYEKYLSPQEDSRERTLANKASIFSYLEVLARENDIALIESSEQKEIEKNVYYFSYPIRLDLESSPGSLLSFFQELNKGDFLIDVKETLIEAKENFLEARIDLEAIVFK